MKFAVAFALAAAVAVAAAAPTPVHLHEPELTFSQFEVKFNKIYAAGERLKRELIFLENLAFIAKHNNDPTQTYKVGVNEFADLTSAEFKQLYLSTPMPVRERNEFVLPETGAADSIDWRSKGAVVPVKNQGQCGSCWSFSTTGSVEGAWAIAGNTLVSLSEQQLVDCSGKYGNNGCNGGLMDDAFKYIIANGGIDTEADYPYTARDGTCDTTKQAKHAAKISGYKDVPKGNAAQMVAALNIGPVSVAIEADQSGFQMYKSGVFSGACGTQLDHGVLAVGYADDYWIVKNSWGTTWGQQGYIYISREKNNGNLCGILNSASYPIVGSLANATKA